MSKARWVAAIAPLGLIAAITIGDVVSATPMPYQVQGPCASSLTPTPTPTPTVPGAPKNVRIIRGESDSVEDEMASVSGPNAGPEDGTPEAPAVATHAYFDQLIQRPDCQIAYSLRSQAEIDKYRYAAEVKVNYDPTTDAAKWSWIRDDESADNLRLPILLERPSSGSRKILIIADHRWDTGWFTEFKKPDGSWMGGWKWLQVTGGKSATNPEQRISFEPRMRVIGEWAAEHPNERDVLALIDAREYMGVRAPTTSYADGCGVSFGQEVIGINGQQGCFKARANRWTRSFIEIAVTAGDEFATISFWMADEQQEPVAIFRNAEVRMFNPIREFWYEYNTSVSDRVGGAMAAWGRNVVVLKDVADPTPLLVKPTR